MKKITYLMMFLLLATSSFSNAQEGNDDQDENEKELAKAPIDFLDIFSPDRRDKEMVMTNTALMVAFGFNQAVGNGNGIGDDYRFWGSGMIDAGLEFSTRLSKESDLLRFTYGLSIKLNSLRINDSRAFQTFDNVTRLENTSFPVDKSRFFQTGLHLPLHLEIGKRGVNTHRDGIKRASDGSAFVVGLGGYLGYTISSAQSFEYEREGRDVTQTIENDFEINNFNYGLSAYLGYEDAQLFVTYGLNEIFKDSPVEQSYLSFGIRLR
jgi:hypothetical protein